MRLAAKIELGARAECELRILSQRRRMRVCVKQRVRAILLG